MTMVMSVEELAQRVREALDDLPTSEALLAAATTIIQDGDADLWAHVGHDAVTIRISRPDPPPPM